MISEIKTLFDEWIAAVARAVNFGMGRYARRRRILLSEDSDNRFTAKMISARKGPALPEISFGLSHGQPDPPLPADWEAAFRGSRVEALMKSGQVLFRSLDFPKQAVDFLDGMIRTQIDRLTPWTADDVVFGWSPPQANLHERVELTLAATSKQEIQPLVQLVTGLEAASIAAFALLPAAAAKIKVFDQPLRGAAGRAPDVPRMLRVALLSAGLAAAASLIAAAYFDSALEFRTATIDAPDFGAPCRASSQPECRRVGAEPPCEAQADEPIERRRARSAVAGAAGQHLCDGAADRG